MEEIYISSGVSGAADKAVLNIVKRKKRKIPFNFFLELKHIIAH